MSSLLLMALLLRCAHSVRLFPSHRRRPLSKTLSSLSLSTFASPPGQGAVSSGDVLLQGLNEAQDISVKVVSCRELVQENIFRNDLTTVAGKALGEVMTSALMMGAGLKGETLQVNIVGDPSFPGLRNVLVITDGELKVRGKVGEPRFYHPNPESASTRELFGDVGQVQVVRNHPTYKNPINGVTALRDAKLALNLAFYMAESEQKPAVIITDVRVDGNLCRSALGLMVERLPGASEENVERSIKNLEEVEKRGLYSYLHRDDIEKTINSEEKMFRDFEPCLNKIIDDCLEGLGEGIRWSKVPSFKCSCSVDRVWGALALLPKSELEDLVNTVPAVEMKCDFCGVNYSIPKDDVIERLLSPLQ